MQLLLLSSDGATAKTHRTNCCHPQITAGSCKHCRNPRVQLRGSNFRDRNPLLRILASDRPAVEPMRSLTHRRAAFTKTIRSSWKPAGTTRLTPEIASIANPGRQCQTPVNRLPGRFSHRSPNRGTPHPTHRVSPRDAAMHPHRSSRKIHTQSRPHPKAYSTIDPPE